MPVFATWTTPNFVFPPTHPEKGLAGGQEARPTGPICYAFLPSRATRYNSDFPSFLWYSMIIKVIWYVASYAGQGGWPGECGSGRSSRGTAVSDPTENEWHKQVPCPTKNIVEKPVETQLASGWLDLWLETLTPVRSRGHEFDSSLCALARRANWRVERPLRSGLSTIHIKKNNEGRLTKADVQKKWKSPLDKLVWL